jgi:hypothetical protein
MSSSVIGNRCWPQSRPTIKGRQRKISEPSFIGFSLVSNRSMSKDDDNHQFDLLERLRGNALLDGEFERCNSGDRELKSSLVVMGLPIQRGTWL